MEQVYIAKAVLRSSEGKYLVLRCSEWPERPDRSLKPDLPGGMVEYGETMVIGVTREVQEEAGIDITGCEMRLAFNGSFLIEDDQKAVTREIYFVQLDTTPDVTLSWEHDKFWWVTADELEVMEWREYYASAFQFMRRTGLLR